MEPPSRNVSPDTSDGAKIQPKRQEPSSIRAGVVTELSLYPVNSELRAVSAGPYQSINKTPDLVNRVLQSD